MTVKVQTPDISDALRRQFQTVGGGGLPLDLDQTIAPVVIVGDVSQERDEAFVDYISAVYRGPTVGQVNRFLFAWSDAAAKVKRVEVRRITLFGVNQITVYIGWGTPQPVGTTATRSRKLEDPAGTSSPGAACRIFDDSNAAAPTAAEFNDRATVQANGRIERDYTDSPWIIPAPNVLAAAPGLGIVAATVNAELHVIVEWREFLSA